MFEPVNQSETVVDGVKKTRQKSRPAGPHEIEPCCIAAASPEKNKKMKAKSMVRRKCQEKDRTGQHNDEFSSEEYTCSAPCEFCVAILAVPEGSDGRSGPRLPLRNGVVKTVSKKWVDGGDKAGDGVEKEKGKASLSLVHHHFTGHHGLWR
jgi:hypothetical protein